VTSTLLRNAVVYSPVDPFATAMLVVDDRIAWIGGEGAAGVHADGVDSVVDLQGALVAPAFVDAHVHTTETGLAMTGVDLSVAPSLRDALDLVSAWARAHPGLPVLGHGWDDGTWPEHRPPTGAELDRAVGGVPAYLSRIDVHSAVVSTGLLELAPAVRAADGFEETGRVRRDAHHLARRAARATVSRERRPALQRAALRRAASLGIACVHELSAPHIAAPDDLQDLLTLVGLEPLPEVIGYWGELDGVRTARSLGATGAAGDLCLDGSLGSRTAWLNVPYADEPASCGHSYLSLEEATGHLVACTRAGLQGGFHVIGDRAVETVVAALRAAAAECGADAVVAARHRLEHLEMLSPPLLADLSRLGVVASVQPMFDALWGGDSSMYAERLGRERAVAMNAFADLSRAGVGLAFGSDSPVTPLGPWEAVRAAAQHHTADQRLTVRAAFAAHTRGGWRAAGVDDSGVLAPGQRASYAVWDIAETDLVVQTPDARVAAWSTDPRAGVQGLPDLSPGAPLPTCLRTVAAGRVIYDRTEDEETAGTDPAAQRGVWP